MTLHPILLNTPDILVGAFPRPPPPHFCLPSNPPRLGLVISTSLLGSWADDVEMAAVPSRKVEDGNALSVVLLTPG